MSRWSAALRLRTRKLLDGIDPFPIGGILRLKNSNDFSAYLTQADLRNGQIILYDTQTQLATCFQSAGELFDAGWIADLQENGEFCQVTDVEGMAELHAHLAAAKNLASHSIATKANRIEPFKTCRAKGRS